MHIKYRFYFNSTGISIPYCGLIILILSFFVLPGQSLAKIYIDINAPSIRKFNIAIPDFKNLDKNKRLPELSTKLPGVISNDLSLSGYFSPIDKEAFLQQKDIPLRMEKINFKDWSVIGAELLLTGGFTCVGKGLEMEIRLFDVYWGRQILGKRVLGDLKDYRYLMHRIGNEIIRELTGQEGIFLTRLSFVGNASGHKEIYVSDYDGHNVSQITKDNNIALLPRWSPDGIKIMYNSYKDGGPMLYMKDISSGAVKRISSRSGLNIGACWSPDGKKVALTMSQKGNPDIFTIDLNGKITRQLTNHWSIDVSPAFSPDGKRIAFVSNRSGSPQIYVKDLNNGREERLTFEGKYITSPAWSSRDRIAFVSMDDGNFNINTINPDGGQLRRLTEGQGNNEDPCWSPDGRYIAFSSNRTGRYHLYIMTAHGQNQRRVTFDRGDQTSPSWAP
jgi:TolB protein